MKSVTGLANKDQHLTFSGKKFTANNNDKCLHDFDVKSNDIFTLNKKQCTTKVRDMITVQVVPILADAIFVNFHTDDTLRVLMDVLHRKREISLNVICLFSMNNIWIVTVKL